MFLCWKLNLWLVKTWGNLTQYPYRYHYDSIYDHLTSKWCVLCLWSFERWGKWDIVALSMSPDSDAT